MDSEEEGRNDTTESSTIDVLCCSGEFCEQEGGLAIIGMSHGCIKCEGRLHGYLCSNRNAEEMNGMTYKQCDSDMAWVQDTEEIGNEEGKEE